MALLAEGGLGSALASINMALLTEVRLFAQKSVVESQKPSARRAMFIDPLHGRSRPPSGGPCL
jgi:hypothetical protein